MSVFSSTIDQFWRTPSVDAQQHVEGEQFELWVNSSIAHDRRVTVLRRHDGFVTAAVSPLVADALALRDPTEQGFRAALQAAGITLHDADYIYYFSQDMRRELMAESTPESVRQLTHADADLFAEFEARNTEQDLDDAYVELDHWAVFGSLSDGKLASAASAYPWDESPLADTGVLSIPDYRGRGHARATVRALSRHIYDRGYEPQYRSQLDNKGSVALAASAGLTLFGTWEVVSPESPV